MESILPDNGVILSSGRSQHSALLKRLKKCLSLLEKKYIQYYRILVLEQKDLAESEFQYFNEHLQFEKRVIKELSALNKVFVPLEASYKADFSLEDNLIESLLKDVCREKDKVLLKNLETREVIREKMETTKTSIQSLYLPVLRKSKPPDTAVPALIDISA